MIYDLTTFESNVKSLSKYLSLAEIDIVDYIERRKEDEIDISEFLDDFNVSENSLLKEPFFLTSLHVTTNMDSCDSIKKHGLMNLQKSVTLQTPLKEFLSNYNISIDIEQKKVIYNDEVIDVSKKYDGIERHVGRKREGLDRVVWKLFQDYQINGFFYHENPLNYGGYVNRRPEFLYDLGLLLGKDDLEREWDRDSKKQCYVVKFFAPISEFTNYTFDINSNVQDKREIEIMKRKWVVQRSLYHLLDKLNGYGVNECFSYLNFEVSIPPSNIMNIYTDKQYTEDFCLN
ncbi:hypothetical protein ABE112_27980 [Priestia aryabhattai]|uniref:hypothetical protein n=1 Tax=Priestia aryabhattai TaxID=412384 RepID=UPI002E1ABA7B|nr:hypothetical protein [Priestia aryabhattai]